MTPLQEALAFLQKQVGQRIHVGPWYELTQEKITAFAEATGDRQWIHVDAERAKSSPFGGTIAHGYFLLSLIPLLTEALREDRPMVAGMKMAINYGMNKARFPAPARSGSRLRATTELVSAEEVEGSPALQMVRRVTIEIEDGSKPACVADTVTRVYF